MYCHVYLMLLAWTPIGLPISAFHRLLAELSELRFRLPYVPAHYAPEARITQAQRQSHPAARPMADAWHVGAGWVEYDCWRGTVGVLCTHPQEGTCGEVAGKEVVRGFACRHNSVEQLTCAHGTCILSCNRGENRSESMRALATLPAGVRLDAWPTSPSLVTCEDSPEIANLREELRKSLPYLAGQLDLLGRVSQLRDLSSRLTGPRPMTLATQPG
jgi:hypothetical protein